MGIAAIFAKSVVSAAIDRLGYKKFLLINTLLLSSFVASMSFIGSGTPYALMLLLFALFGVANSFQFTAVNTLSLIDLPDSMISGGNTLLSVVMQASMAMGVALAAFLLAAVSDFQEARNFRAHELLFTFHLTYLIIGIISVLCCIIFLFIPEDAGSKVKDHDGLSKGAETAPVN
jgi:MFS family permease